MIKLLIFDIGGVLIKFGEEDYVRYIARKHGLSYRKLAKVLFPLIAKMELGRLTVKRMESIMNRKFRLNDPTMEWDSAFKRLARPYPEMKQLVSRLEKRYTLALLTNVSESRYVIINRMYI
ncbi:MAG: hypothetical protein ACREBW_08245, partial [Candidatus Micrarchaeaceae archaeon]